MLIAVVACPDTSSDSEAAFALALATLSSVASMVRFCAARSSRGENDRSFQMRSGRAVCDGLRPGNSNPGQAADGQIHRNRVGVIARVRDNIDIAVGCPDLGAGGHMGFGVSRRCGGSRHEAYGNTTEPGRGPTGRLGALARGHTIGVGIVPCPHAKAPRFHTALMPT